MKNDAYLANIMMAKAEASSFIALQEDVGVGRALINSRILSGDNNFDISADKRFVSLMEMSMSSKTKSRWGFVKSWVCEEARYTPIYHGSRFTKWNQRKNAAVSLRNKGTTKQDQEPVKLLNNAVALEYAEVERDVGDAAARIKTDKEAQISKTDDDIIINKITAEKAKRHDTADSRWEKSDAGLAFSGISSIVDTIEATQLKKEVIHRLDVNSDFHWHSAHIRIVGPHVQGTGMPTPINVNIGSLIPKSKAEKKRAKSSPADYYELDDTRQKLVQVGYGVRCPTVVDHKNWDVTERLSPQQINMRFEVLNQGRADSEGFVVVIRVDNLGEESVEGWDLPLKIICKKKPVISQKHTTAGALDKNGKKDDRQKTTLDETHEGLVERIWSTQTHVERVAVRLPPSSMDFGPASLLRTVPNVAYPADGAINNAWSGLESSKFSQKYTVVWSGMIRIPMKGEWEFSLETIGAANGARLYVTGDQISLKSLSDDPWAASNTGESPVFQEDGIADRNYYDVKHVEGATRVLEDIDTTNKLLIKKEQLTDALVGNKKTVSGKKVLGTGIHAIEILMISRGDHNRALLSWEGPSQPKEVIPPNAFFYTPGQVVARSDAEDDKNTGGGAGVKVNQGKLDIFLNDVKLTTGTHGNPGPVHAFHYPSHTEWSYSLRPWQLSHLHDGVNTVRVERAAAKGDDKNDRAVIISSSIIESRVGITNEFFKGDGATSAFLVPYDKDIYSHMRAEFTVMAWVKLDGQDTEDEDVVIARHEHFFLHATGKKKAKRMKESKDTLFYCD